MHKGRDRGRPLERLRAAAPRVREEAQRWRDVRWPIWRQSIEARRRGLRVVHMLHPGKTGGTALKYVLRRNRETSTHFIFPHPHKIRLVDIPPWDDFFFFVRDPVDRYVSGFNSRLREGRPRYVKPWTLKEKWAFKRFSTAEELALALGSEDRKRRREAERAMRSIRHVNKGYDNWVGSGPMLRRRRNHLLMVGRLETIDADFIRLKRVLNLPADAALPAAEKAAHKDPGVAPRTLSDEAKANIRRWYDEDYRLMELFFSMDQGRSSVD